MSSPGVLRKSFESFDTAIEAIVDEQSINDFYFKKTKCVPRRPSAIGVRLGQVVVKLDTRFTLAFKIVRRQGN